MCTRPVSSRGRNRWVAGHGSVRVVARRAGGAARLLRSGIAAQRACPRACAPPRRREACRLLRRSLWRNSSASTAGTVTASARGFGPRGRRLSGVARRVPRRRRRRARFLRAARSPITARMLPTTTRPAKTRTFHERTNTSISRTSPTVNSSARGPYLMSAVTRTRPIQGKSWSSCSYVCVDPGRSVIRSRSKWRSFAGKPPATFM